MRNVYIDFANLNSECKSMNIEIDFNRFFIYLKNKFKSDNIYIFTGYLEKYENTYKEFESIGFQYIFKEAVFNEDEKKIKANVDVDITINAVVDVIEKSLVESILVTSDGDFASLVKFLKTRKVDVKIISPATGKRCSYLLRKENNKLTFLKDILHNFIKQKDPR